MNRKPIFYDPNQRRWPRVKRGVFLLGFILTLIFGIGIFTIISNPRLQDLALHSTTILPNGGRPIPPRQRELQKHLKESINVDQFANKSTSQKNRENAPAKSVGFYVDWDDASFSSLRANLDNLDIVIGEWMHLANADGSIIEDDPDREQLAVDYVRQHKPDTKLIVLINNYGNGGWQTKQVEQMFASETARQKNIQQILAYVQHQQMNGVSIDYENFSPNAQQNFVKYLSELYPKFHQASLTVSVNVLANYPDAYDYQHISQNADYVILMMYDQHYAGGDPGPVSGIDWYSEILKTRISEIPTNKLIVGLANYGYDWQVGAKEATERTFEESVLTAKESEGVVETDPSSLNPHFDYYDDNNAIHRLWFLDATTAYNEEEIAEPLHPFGFGIWRLGSEDPTVWKVLGRSPSDLNPEQDLSSLNYGYDLDYEGQGEILNVTSEPSSGQRSLTLDQKSGLITSENFTQFPSPYVITRYGAADHKLALTFDDGPDPTYTPQILNILKQNGVAGTFFIIGANGEENPGLLKQEIANGDDIGNHTFTHPNIAQISGEQLNLQVSATERLLESVIGRESHLFRPPYAEDAEPDTADEVRPVDQLNRSGYLIVGMQIDPNDWKRPGVDQIVNSVVQQANAKRGNVILLHDGGGDRSQTIAALPKIIAAAKAQGYQFVTISQLLGKSQDEVMPKTANEHFLQRWGNMATFQIMYFFSHTVSLLFILGIILGLLRLALIAVLALIESRKKHIVALADANRFSVSVVIPAHNEGMVIEQTVASLLAADHPEKFEIIVVDDGSTDNTFKVVQESFANEAQVKVFTIKNSGKPEASNFGISKASGEIIITLDADTVFTKDTIMQLVQHFADPEVGAVAGNTKVGNRINLMTRMQALEYITSQNLDRRAFHVLNAITVVPGAVGAWRKDLIFKAGCFSAETLAEDADLTLKILEMGYKVLYEDRAIALTEAPDTIRAFVRQRYRWMFGTFQTAVKHIKKLFNPEYKYVGFVALPNIFIYQIFFPLISPLMDLLMVLSVIFTLLDRYQHPTQYATANLERILYFYALFLAADFITAFIAFMLEKRENKRLLVWLFLQRFFYRQLIYFVAIKSIKASLVGQEVGWNKVERKGTVKL